MLIHDGTHGYAWPHASHLGIFIATWQSLKMSIYRLIYVSNSLLTLDGLGISIGQIENISMRRNGVLNITGCLICCRGRFAGMLEGERTVIETMMDRIRRDLRHDGVTMLGLAAYDERIFASWSLAYVGKSLFVAALIDRALHGMHEDIARLTRTIIEFAQAGQTEPAGQGDSAQAPIAAIQS